MKLTWTIIVGATLLFASAAAAGVDELAVGGSYMWDVTAWSGVEETQDGVWDDVEFANGSETRRARVYLKGKVYENLRFKAAYELAGGDEIALVDAYLELTGVPAVGRVRIGQFLEPMCFTELTSSNSTSFMERASLNAFAPSRNAGVMIHGYAAEGRLYHQMGLLLDTGKMAEKRGDEDYSFAARLAYRLSGEEGGDRVLHLGGAFNYLVPDAGVRFRQRPEVHLSDRLIDTGTMVNVDSVYRLGLEAAGVLGSFHAAGEVIVTTVSRSDDHVPANTRGDVWLTDDASMSGYYLEIGYFLTGEHRAYSAGLWGRTRPSSNFLEDGGLGVWEVLARYSGLNLNEDTAGVYGGEMINRTLGVNWHLHSNARLMFNYVMSTVNDQDGGELGRANALSMRTQFDF